MPRYEYVEPGENGSRKFWEISLEGSAIVRRWGRIGTNGQSKRNAFPDPREAQREYEELIAEKRAKGYELVEGIERAPAAKPVTTPPNPELERALEESPGDEEAWLVYADWLQSHGDPRGELMALQIAMRRETDPVKFLPLKRREAELTHDHKPHWHAGIEAEPHRFTHDWRNGFVYKVTLAHGSIEKLRALLDHPSGRFFQEIELSGELAQAGVDLLAAAARPRTLRRMTISFGEVSSLAAFSRAFPRLERLTFRGTLEDERKGGDDAMPSFPSLRSLALHGVYDDALLSLRWPALESLVLWPGGRPGKPPARFDRLLDAAERMPNLRVLEIGSMEDADDFVTRLADSPLLRGLTRLSLRTGSLSARGAGAIVAARERFAHLEKLALSTSVPKALYEALRTVCREVEVSLDVDVRGEPRTGPRGELPRRYEPVRE